MSHPQIEFNDLILKNMKLLYARVNEIEKAFEILKVALETKVSDAPTPR